MAFSITVTNKQIERSRDYVTLSVTATVFKDAVEVDSRSFANTVQVNTKVSEVYDSLVNKLKEKIKRWYKNVKLQETAEDTVFANVEQDIQTFVEA